MCSVLSRLTDKAACGTSPVTQRVEATEAIPWWAMMTVVQDLAQAICHVRQRVVLELERGGGGGGQGRKGRTVEMLFGRSGDIPRKTKHCAVMEWSVGEKRGLLIRYSGEQRYSLDRPPVGVDDDDDDDR